LAIADHTSSPDFFLVRTKGILTYMEYGSGDHRLSGAKMIYLDSGILLKVIDSLVIDYIVALTSSLNAFIQKTNVIADTVNGTSTFYRQIGFIMHNKSPDKFARKIREGLTDCQRLIK
jgi:hypothetical protein